MKAPPNTKAASGDSAGATAVDHQATGWLYQWDTKEMASTFLMMHPSN